MTRTGPDGKNLQEKTPADEISRCDPGNPSGQLLQITGTKNQVGIGKGVQSHLGTRQVISNRSTYIANVFQSRKELIVRAKYEICKRMGSVMTWLACTLERVKLVSSLAGGKIRHLLPEPYAAFATQFMFGKQDQADKELYQLFKTTGMLDLLVISGFHLQITASLCYASINKLVGKTQASILVMICIWAFMLMLPRSIPVERAVLATTVALTAKILSRSYNPKLTLIAIALCMFIRNNDVVVSLSFQLSFLASAVILWVYPIITGISSKIEDMSSGGLISTLIEAAVLSLVVTTAFAPLLSYYFGYISLVGLLISPVFSLFLPLIFVGIWVLAIFPVEGFWFDIGIAAASILKGILEGLFYLMESAARIEQLSFNYKINSIWPLVIWYSSIAGFVAIHHFFSHQKLTKKMSLRIAHD